MHARQKKGREPEESAEVIQKRLELQKKTRDLLQKQIAQQKVREREGGRERERERRGGAEGREGEGGAEGREGEGVYVCSTQALPYVYLLLSC